MENPTDYCRICINEGAPQLQLRPSQYSENKDVVRFMLASLGIEAHENGGTLSRQICLECHEKLKSVAYFLQTRLDTQEFLDHQETPVFIKKEPAWSRKLEQAEDDDDHFDDPLEPAYIPEIEIKEEKTVLRPTAVVKKAAAKKRKQETNYSVYYDEYACDHCDFQTTKKREIKNHILSAHFRDTSSRYFCDMCDRSYTVKEILMQHKAKDHFNNITYYYCAHCPAKFFRKFDLRDHVTNIHIHGGERRYFCQLCDSKFVSYQNLLKHARTVHPKEPFNCPNRPPLVRRKNAEPKENHCEVCKKNFRWPAYLQSHLEHDHDRERPECSICHKRVIAHRLKIHENKHRWVKKHYEQEKAICDQCGKEYANKFSLKTHIEAVHTKWDPQFCPICTKMCKDHISLAAHMKNIHTQSQKWLCELCSKEFATKALLKTHKDGVHREGPPLECSVCGAHMKSKFSMRVHMVIHTKGKARQCDKCDKTFVRTTELREHMETHNDNRTWKFVCKVCGKGYLSKTGMRYHKQQHVKANEWFK